jgi:hypothetical protein
MTSAAFGPNDGEDPPAPESDGGAAQRRVTGRERFTRPRPARSNTRHHGPRAEPGLPREAVTARS